MLQRLCYVHCQHRDGVDVHVLASHVPLWLKSSSVAPEIFLFAARTFQEHMHASGHASVPSVTLAAGG